MNVHLFVLIYERKYLRAESFESIIRVKKAKLLNAFERLQARWRYLYIGLGSAIRSSNSRFILFLHPYKSTRPQNKSFRNNIDIRQLFEC